MAQNGRINPISQAEMARHLERLKEAKVADRFTISDMAFLTGWTPEYLYRLEKDRRIPVAKRVGSLRGDPGRATDKRRSGPDRRGRVRVWSDEDARTIMGFKRDQDAKFADRGLKSAA